ncbi:MAG: hypothetical protein ACREP6_16190, partial [Candidatus Binataceae bacterium]
DNLWTLSSRPPPWFLRRLQCKFDRKLRVLGRDLGFGYLSKIEPSLLGLSEIERLFFRLYACRFNPIPADQTFSHSGSWAREKNQKFRGMVTAAHHPVRRMDKRH